MYTRTNVYRLCVYVCVCVDLSRTMPSDDLYERGIGNQCVLERSLEYIIVSIWFLLSNRCFIEQYR